MIKCEVTASAIISRAAQVKKDKEDKDFVTFGIKVPVHGRNGEKKDMEISVSVNGGKEVAAVYTQGRRVSVTGVMSVRKKDGKMFFNLRSSKDVELLNTVTDETISGTMEFRGKIGKKGVEERKDKNDKVFKAFQAFSSEKQEEGKNPEFIWVRFLYFNPNEGEDFLKADSYIEAKGDLQLGVFKRKSDNGDTKEEITFDCLVKSVTPWVLDK